MIAPLTRIVMEIEELRATHARLPRGFRLRCGCSGGGSMREHAATELRAAEQLKARIVTDGLLAQAETASARCIAARRIPPTEF